MSLEEGGARLQVAASESVHRRSFVRARAGGRVRIGASDTRDELLYADAQMRRVRWFAAAFALAQFTLYRPPPGVTVPINVVAVGVCVTALIVAVNVLSLAARRIEDVAVLEWVGTGQLVADTLLAVGVVWIFNFDGSSALWALLVFPIVEGAVRAQLYGAIGTWAVGSIAYVMRDLTAARFYPEIDFRVGSVVYRMGIMFIVAAASGYLAKILNDRINDVVSAQRQSERRAEVLRHVAAAGRAMTTLDADSVFSAAVDCCAEIGFEAPAIALLDGDSDSFELVHARGPARPYGEQTYPSSVGVVSVVRERRETVLIDERSEWQEAFELSQAFGFRVLVGSPIFCDGDMQAVLVAGTTERSRISAYEVECVELLAAQAGAALNNARQFAQRRVLEEKLQHEAFHDSLTGLANRALFLDRLSHRLARKGAHSPTAVLFLDLDGFEKVNDSLGHEAGDQLLRMVGSRLLQSRQDGDTVARFGGDEFSVLIEEPLSQQWAIDSAERIVHDLKNPFLIDDHPVFVSASVGVAFGSQAPGQVRDFLREAHLAMHRAKEQGGGCWSTYRPDLTVRAEHRMELEHDLRRALAEHEFEVHYQPVVSVHDRRVVALEALVRWRHPQRGLVFPLDFVPFAEETGLIVQLGRWVLDEVCAQLSTWRDTETGMAPVPVGVNLSAEEFRQPNFTEHVIAAFDTHKTEPSDVVFELTESVVMRDDRAAITQMRRLQDLGVHMAVDDFGLGYSSLSYLKRFPFSILKIDKSFVAGITKAEADQAIVRSILSLARDLEMAVVAEGVENSEQLDYLGAIGCEFVQGFYLCKPMNAGELSSFVSATSAA